MSDAIAAALLASQRRQSRPSDRMRQYGARLMQPGTGPILHPLQGLAEALTMGMGGYFQGQADREDEARSQRTMDMLAGMLGAKDTNEMQAIAKGAGAVDNEVAGPALAMMVGERQKQLAAGRNADAFTTGFGAVTNQPTGGAAPPPMAQGGNDPGSGVPEFESGGKYDAVNPKTGAAGKYQVMPANIGPWTKQYFGQELTPEQFIANPAAQDAVWKGKFLGEYVPKYGPQGARAAWFAGEGGMNNPNAKDANGVSVAQYVQRTTPPQGDAVPRADASGTPLPPSTTVPDVPRPQPSQEQIAKYQTLIRNGSMSDVQARQALDAELDKEWTYQRENRRMQWQQTQEDERAQRKARMDLEQKGPMELIQRRADAVEKDLRPKAEAASQDISVIHGARQLLDAGAFTGMGAGGAQFGSRLAQMFGLDWGADQQANTAALQSTLSRRVLENIKSLGANPSDADRMFLEKVNGAGVEVGEKAIRQILDIGERWARKTLKNYESETGRLRKLPGMNVLPDDYFAVSPAPTYEEWSKANPMQGAQPQQPPQVSQAQKQGAAPVQQAGAVARPQSKQEYDALPSGTVFLAPDGSRRTKP